MADPASRDPNVPAYIPRNDGDVIRADEWNDIQRCARQDIRRHRHTQDAANPDDGLPIGAEGIDAGAITTEKIQNNAVNRAKIQDNAINADKLDDNAVTRDKVLDGSDSIVCNFPIADDITLLQDLKKFSNDRGLGRPAIAGDPAGNMHAVWWGFNSSTNKNTIWYARLNSAGEVTIEPVNKLDSGTNTNDSPAITVDLDGNLQIIWTGQDPTTQQRALWYAKLRSDGGTLTGPQLKVNANPQAPPAGAPKGNFFPDLAVDSDGNLQLVWRGRDSNSVDSIWYAKLDKNGGSIFNPAPKLIGSQQDKLQFPVAVVDTDGKLQIYWLSQGGPFNIPNHARLDANGNIEILPATYLPLLTANGFVVADALSKSNGNVLLAGVGFFPTGYIAFFMEVDSAGDLASPVINKFYVPLRGYQRNFSATLDNESKVHIIFEPTSFHLAYAKLDVDKVVEDASLTELMTTYRRFNF